MTLTSLVRCAGGREEEEEEELRACRSSSKAKGQAHSVKQEQVSVGWEEVHACRCSIKPKGQAHSVKQEEVYLPSPPHTSTVWDGRSCVPTSAAARQSRHAQSVRHDQGLVSTCLAPIPVKLRCPPTSKDAPRVHEDRTPLQLATSMYSHKPTPQIPCFPQQNKWTCMACVCTGFDLADPAYHAFGSVEPGMKAAGEGSWWTAAAPGLHH
eukprot:1137465-Pelagomonas_calceolata.AAC.6